MTPAEDADTVSPVSEPADRPSTPLEALMRAAALHTGTPPTPVPASVDGRTDDQLPSSPRPADPVPPPRRRRKAGSK